MPSRRPESGRSNNPATFIGEVTVGTNINPGSSLFSQPLECAGFRRYRVKVFSVFGPVEVHAHDMRFQQDATLWEDVNLGPTVPVAGGFAMVGNFGEGTGVLETIGPYVRIRMHNNTAGIVRVNRFELWGQA